MPVQIESGDKWVADTINVKCPAENDGILEQILVDKSIYTYRIRFKFVGGEAKKYILQRADFGKEYKIFEIFDIDNPTGNSAAGRRAIAEAERIVTNYCNNSSDRPLLDAIIKYNYKRYYNTYYE
ncbi:hypothetical protein [Methylobacterium fujisawaense]